MSNRFAISVVVALAVFSAMTSRVCAQLQNGEITGIQTIGERGITQTVASLMQMQAQRDAHQARPEDKSAADVPHRNEKSGGIAAANVTLGLQFDAMSRADSAFLRPNESMDVGPTQILVIADGRLRSFDKQTGAADGALNLDPRVLFASVLPDMNALVFDQHIRFDRATQRWFIIASELPRQVSGTYLQNSHHDRGE